ncbi:hypothetical protein LTS08_008564 [Lithohypha guttulata]|nr:hypothetical protein LTS08_008564 [Lithohypha guttulata]
MVKVAADLPPEIIFQILDLFNAPDELDIDLTFFEAGNVSPLWQAAVCYLLFEIDIGALAMSPGFWCFLEDRVTAMKEQVQEYQQNIQDARQMTKKARKKASDLGIHVAPYDGKFPDEFFEEEAKKRTESRNDFIQETQQIMKFCGSWNEEPVTLDGDRREILWTTLVQDRINSSSGWPGTISGRPLLTTKIRPIGLTIGELKIDDEGMYRELEVREQKTIEEVDPKPTRRLTYAETVSRSFYAKYSSFGQAGRFR